MLSKHPDNCKFPHGHTRKVEFVLEADELDAGEMVCDFKIIKTVIKEYIMSFDHAMCINTDDPQYAFFKETYGPRVIEFTGKDPTSELMAKTIYDTFKQRLSAYGAEEDPRYPLAKGVRVVKVRLWETSSSWAEYSE
jgi:6-pyruvoyltetrahydropterin/6-carboxytetrahydropterin synthase